MASIEVSAHLPTEAIEPGACLALLASEPIGRVVFVDGPQPLAMPVNFVIDDGGVAFRSAVGTKLDKALREPGALVAFQADRYDDDRQDGWSVIIKGTIHPVTSTVEQHRLDRSGLRPWTDLGHGARWVRVRSREITGRRLRTRTPR